MAAVEGDEGRCPSLPSSTDIGKGRDASIVIPTITIFLPRSLRHRLIKTPSANLLLGWCFSGGPTDDKLFIVITGLGSQKQVDECRIGQAEGEADKVDPVCVVGRCSFKPSSGPSSSQGRAVDKKGKVWVEVGLQEGQIGNLKLPEIASIQAPMVSTPSAQCAVNVIRYTVPRADRMRYMSLETMILPNASSAGVLDRAGETVGHGKEEKLKRRLEELVRLDPLRFQEVAQDYKPGRAPGEGFRRAIMLINQCSYLNDTVANSTSSRQNGVHSKRPSSLSCASWLARFGRLACQSARSILGVRVSGVAITDISATARQLDLRLGQCLIWPSLGRHLRSQRRQEQSPVSSLAPRYIALYNGVWLVLNDVILGQAVGLQICERHAAIANFTSGWLRFLLVDVLIDMFSWLDNWPAGLKLNTQLSHFFRDMFVGMTTAWNDVVISTLTAKDGKFLSGAIYSVGLCSRLAGLTMLFSITIDVLQLVTFHCTIYYRIQQAIFSFFCTTIFSLFHLFRGKKRNPLRRNRIDQATYELDQLLLGTIFFTLFVFLFLTVAVYYLHLGVLRLSLVAILAILQTGLAILNHLPLFALMLRLKEPDRLPGGVQLRQPPSQADAVNGLQCYYYELHNSPLDLQGIFLGYNEHLQAISNLPRLLLSLALGRRF